MRSRAALCLARRASLRGDAVLRRGWRNALSEDLTLTTRRTLMSQCEYGPRIGVPRLLGLLDHLAVPATFFIPGYIAENHPRAKYVRAHPQARRELDFDRQPL